MFRFGWNGLDSKDGPLMLVTAHEQAMGEKEQEFQSLLEANDAQTRDFEEQIAALHCKSRRMVMIDISKGRFWDLPWSLVDGCTPCSPGCDHCWSAGMTHRFRSWKDGWNPDRLTDIDGKFTGRIITHPERLSIPLKRRKPTVYAVWNDWAHESVPREFIVKMLDTAMQAYFEHGHVTLFLTKRAGRAAQEVILWAHLRGYNLNDCGLFFGLTVVNQQEADEKIPLFLQVPGKKFLSLEPCLSQIDVLSYLKGGNNYDRERTGVYDSGSARCVQCGQGRECMATRQDDGGQPKGDTILHQDVQLSPERSDEYEERLSDGDVFARTSETIRNPGSSGCLDDCESFGHPRRDGDKPQGRKTSKSSSPEFGDGNSLTKHTSFHQKQAGEEGRLCKIDGRRCDRNQATMESRTNDTGGDSRALSHKSISSGIHCPKKNMEASSISCVICGGETGPGARPMHPDWVRSVRDQCVAAGVAFFFKGWGKHLPEFKDCIGDAKPGPLEALTMDIRRLSDGRTHDDLPWLK